VFAFIWRWRTSSRGTGWLFGVYMVLAGLERFAIEFLRAKDDRLLPAGLSVAQVASIQMVIGGVIVMSRLANASRVPPGPWLLTGSNIKADPSRRP
jgi:phosphatidylglycerol:prolipoprotein diacylglycerol transferase